ncbi:MAG: fructose bisphosphate aldolase [Rhodobacteraceae bacterium]|jgi:fructose-bisphosphate aldolase class I|uniref:fructose bisphosphate aldolase n=1 Tax=Planktotalea sp. TaxID=2029877 RepID=UPI0001839898|nr:fructose bisphosphate aldolase [Planktotalea sp.]EDZ41231.1 fructose-bisphosphate aldolase class-I [Rhodobacteraceae bacterium HTCC2083]MBT5823405.1 fructose bisphosphate aldolase [Paracoccaceae bacterium]MDG1084792.1 fructose bisphosphate aldolase [Planktotalea sp.]HCW83162.1 fructose bisphosphate aldolase [Paracoccaceae bacterium]
MTNPHMADKIRTGNGFIAALDQSGGSTPKSLRLYGVKDSDYNTDAEMFDLIHCMRARIVSSPAFTGERVIGAILFEMTMEREIGGKPSAKALWEDNGVVPFLKIDKGLEDVADGAQVLKPMPVLDELLKRAVSNGVFGTKARSVISAANVDGIRAVVQQQFKVGNQVLAAGLVPIIEPEVTIDIADKAEAEQILLNEITIALDTVPEGQQIMLKLTLPEVANTYAALNDHPKVMKVVALSGGYDRAEATKRLSQNKGMIASFSRALTEGLSHKQSDNEFNATLDGTIAQIHEASIAG